VTKKATQRNAIHKRRAKSPQNTRRTKAITFIITAVFKDFETQLKIDEVNYVVLADVS